MIIYFSNSPCGRGSFKIQFIFVYNYVYVLILFCLNNKILSEKSYYTDINALN